MKTGKTLLEALFVVSMVLASGASPAEEAASAEATQTPQLKVKTGYAEDLRDYSNTVVVPTAYVKLLVDGSVFVSKSGSALQSLGGGNSNTVNAGAKYQVAGIDEELARSLAKQAYDDFVGQLRAAGYTVLTYDDIKDRDYVRSASRDKGDAKYGLPTESAPGSRDTYVVAAPSAEQQFKIGFTGVFAEFVKFGKPKFTDATVIIPQYTFVAPQVWGETDSGFNRIEAGINAQPGMNMQSAMAIWMGKPKVRMGGGNAAGVVTAGPMINIIDKAGELVKVDTTSGAANGVSKALSMLSGAGSVSQNRSQYTYNIDREAYVRGALSGITQFNAEVGKAAKP